MAVGERAEAHDILEALRELDVHGLRLPDASQGFSVVPFDPRGLSGLRRGIIIWGVPRPQRIDNPWLIVFEQIQRIVLFITCRRMGAICGGCGCAGGGRWAHTGGAGEQQVVGGH